MKRIIFRELTRLALVTGTSIVLTGTVLNLAGENIPLRIVLIVILGIINGWFVVSPAIDWAFPKLPIKQQP